MIPARLCHPTHVTLPYTTIAKWEVLEGGLACAQTVNDEVAPIRAARWAATSVVKSIEDRRAAQEKAKAKEGDLGAECWDDADGPAAEVCAPERPATKKISMMTSAGRKTVELGN